MGTVRACDSAWRYVSQDGDSIDSSPRTTITGLSTCHCPLSSQMEPSLISTTEWDPDGRRCIILSESFQQPRALTWHSLWGNAGSTESLTSHNPHSLMAFFPGSYGGFTLLSMWQIKHTWTQKRKKKKRTKKRTRKNLVLYRRATRWALKESISWAREILIAA